MQENMSGELIFVQIHAGPVFALARIQLQQNLLHPLKNVFGIYLVYITLDITSKNVLGIDFLM